MTEEARRTRPESWLAAIWSLILRVVVVSVLLYALYRVRMVIVVVFLAAMLALAVAPLVDWVQRQPWLCRFHRHTRRSVATGLVFMILTVLLAELAFVVAKPLVLELQQFVREWSTHRQQFQHHVESARAWYANLPPDLRQAIEKQNPGDAGARMSAQVQQVLVRTVDSVMFLVEMILVPVLAFSFLTESRPLKREITAILPRHRLRDGLHMMKQSAEILQSYAVGQLILAVIAGCVTWLLLTMLNVKYALALAVIAAITRVIPVIGPLLGGIPVVLITLITSKPEFALPKAAAVLVIFTCMHLIETKVVMPRIIGHRINLHPAVVIIVLLIGAEFFGMWGMFLAAPVAAVAKALFHYLYIRRRRTARPQTPTPPAAAPEKEPEVERLAIGGLRDRSRAH